MNQETRQGGSLGALSSLFLWASKEITKEKHLQIRRAVACCRRDGQFMRTLFSIRSGEACSSRSFDLDLILFFLCSFLLRDKNEPRNAPREFPWNPSAERIFEMRSGNRAIKKQRADIP